MKFVMIDLTSSATAAVLKPTASFFQSLVAALMEQVTKDFSPAYGIPAPVSFRIASGPTDRSTDEIAMNFRDSLPDAPGALAYHATTNGVPDIEIGCDLFSTLSSGSESVSSGTSHELLETLGDPGANEWADKQDGSGTTEAHETCDPVQNTTYNASNGFSLSNFVLPSYFIPESVGPWDHLGVMTSQADISNGYAMRATAPGDVQDIQGKKAMVQGRHVSGTLSRSQEARKKKPWSRTYRRGVRLA